MNSSSNNATGNTAAAAADASSIQMLKIQVAVNITLLPIAFIGIIINSIVVITIAKSKSLHNKSQFLLLSEAIVDFCFCCTSFGTSIQKCVYAANGWPDTNYQWKCAWQFIYSYFIFGRMPAYFLCIISIDRLLAISVPVFYRNIRKPVYVATSNAICWGICIGHIPFWFYYDTVQSMRWMICRFVSFAPPTYQIVNNAMNTTLLSITCSAYGFSLIIVSLRYFRAKNLNKEQKKEFRRQMDINMFKMMMVMLTVYLMCVGASNIGSTLGATYLSPEALTMFNPFLNLLIPVHSALHMLIYIRMSPSFRESLKKLISVLLTDNSVHSIAIDNNNSTLNTR